MIDAGDAVVETGCAEAVMFKRRAIFQFRGLVIASHGMGHLS